MEVIISSCNILSKLSLQYYSHEISVEHPHELHDSYLNFLFSFYWSYLAYKHWSWSILLLASSICVEYVKQDTTFFDIFLFWLCFSKEMHALRMH